MRVILLGTPAARLKEFLETCNVEVSATDLPLSQLSHLKPTDFLVSYGYRHLLKKQELGFFERKPINLHISFLPWNRGADPNLWSILEETPSGVTIHEIDTGLDTGNVLLQKKVTLADNDTLRTSYEKLCRQIEDLFRNNWQALSLGQVAPSQQPARGSYHRSADKGPFLTLLNQGWDTPVNELRGKALPSKKSL